MDTLRYSFDDGHIGVPDEDNTLLVVRLISRPPGLTNTAWYDHAARVCRLLNQEAPA